MMKNSKPKNGKVKPSAALAKVFVIKVGDAYLCQRSQPSYYPGSLDEDGLLTFDDAVQAQELASRQYRNARLYQIVPVANPGK